MRNIQPPTKEKCDLGMCDIIVLIMDVKDEIYPSKNMIESYFKY